MDRTESCQLHTQTLDYHQSYNTGMEKGSQIASV